MFGTREMEINMGPQHPSTHGVLRLVLELDGERVVGTRPVIGYLHRGCEKLGEDRTYPQAVVYTDRMDYCAAYSENLVYIEAVERLLGVEVPPRAQYMRVILAELQRIASHLIWLGTHAMDIGALTVFVYGMREREQVLDLFESYCGARLTYNALRIGGMPEDFPEGWIDEARRFLELFPARLEEYHQLLTANRIWLGRTRDVGTIDGPTALDWGMTGPCLRGLGRGVRRPQGDSLRGVRGARLRRAGGRSRETPTTGTCAGWRRCVRAAGSSCRPSTSSPPARCGARSRAGSSPRRGRSTTSTRGRAASWGST